MYRSGSIVLCVVIVHMLGTTPLVAQDDDVRSAIEETLVAWNNGDHEEFCSYFMEQEQGFWLDGSVLDESFCDVEQQRASYEAGFQPSLQLRQVTVRVYGNFAVAAAYMVGTIALSPDQVLAGTWRYTEARVKDEGEWKIVQWHFSALDPM